MRLVRPSGCQQTRSSSSPAGRCGNVHQAGKRQLDHRQHLPRMVPGSNRTSGLGALPQGREHQPGVPTPMHGLLDFRQSGGALRFARGKSAEEQDMVGAAPVPPIRQRHDASVPILRGQEPHGGPSVGSASDQHAGLDADTGAQLGQQPQTGYGSEHDPSAPSAQMEGELAERISGERQLVSDRTRGRRRLAPARSADLFGVAQGESAGRCRSDDTTQREGAQLPNGWIGDSCELAQPDRQGLIGPGRRERRSAPGEASYELRHAPSSRSGGRPAGERSAARKFHDDAASGHGPPPSETVRAARSAKLRRSRARSGLRPTRSPTRPHPAKCWSVPDRSGGCATRACPSWTSDTETRAGRCSGP
ncbi:protein of unassigned function [Methylobacterium oryzae CBMB20]|uniref:Protein of unassigned function n=1 Tax=Methylobacterium oryzae CBMB20 TaxID=693986 RepID=A0A089P0C8_9HYPH|nr:protein of unassigned function [Methylobacterium oryzae CBMB20]